MTIIEQDAPLVLERGWEFQPVPDDFGVVYKEPEEDADPQDPITIEAFWNGETKVSLEVDYYEGVRSVDTIGRPDHWGDDQRAAPEQKQEYALGLDGILGKMMRESPYVIEVNRQQGITAEAVMAVRAQPGWKKSTKIESYDQWTEGTSISFDEAVADGAVISVRFERKSSPHPGLGLVAVENARVEAQAA